ncbi:MAG: hypothetical protein FWB99_04605 [Treponema sp.]|nr:hypothetical protein [Treponema sp.]
MALIVCPEPGCKYSFSSTAVKCPKCGFPFREHQEKKIYQAREKEAKKREREAKKEEKKTKEREELIKNNKCPECKHELDEVIFYSRHAPRLNFSLTGRIHLHSYYAKPTYSEHTERSCSDCGWKGKGENKLLGTGRDFPPSIDLNRPGTAEHHVLYLCRNSCGQYVFTEGDVCSECDSRMTSWEEQYWRRGRNKEAAGKIADAKSKLHGGDAKGALAAIENLVSWDSSYCGVVLYDKDFQEIRKNFSFYKRITRHIKEKAWAERKEKVGLGLQFGIMLAFFCALWGTGIANTIVEAELFVPAIIIPGAISLVFGLISLLLRKDTSPQRLPWGSVMLILLLAVFTVTLSVLDGGGVLGSVIFTTIPAILMLRALYLLNDGIKDFLIWTIGGAVVVAIVGGIAADVFDNNGSMFAFPILAVPAIPGIMTMHKAEDPCYSGFL